MQRAYRSPAEMWWIAFMLRRLSGSSVPTGGMDRSAGVAICRSAAGRGSMTGPPEDMTETPDLVGTRHGRIIRRLAGGAFDGRRVPARRVLRAVVHSDARRARALRACSRDRVPPASLSLRR